MAVANYAERLVRVTTRSVAYRVAVDFVVATTGVTGGTFGEGVGVPSATGVVLVVGVGYYIA